MTTTGNLTYSIKKFDLLVTCVYVTVVFYVRHLIYKKKMLSVEEGHTQPYLYNCIRIDPLSWGLVNFQRYKTRLNVLGGDSQFKKFRSGIYECHQGGLCVPAKYTVYIISTRENPMVSIDNAHYIVIGVPLYLNQSIDWDIVKHGNNIYSHIFKKQRIGETTATHPPEYNELNITYPDKKCKSNHGYLKITGHISEKYRVYQVDEIPNDVIESEYHSGSFTGKPESKFTHRVDGMTCTYTVCKSNSRHGQYLQIYTPMSNATWDIGTFIELILEDEDVMDVDIDGSHAMRYD